MSKTGGYVTSSGKVLCVHCKDQARGNPLALKVQFLTQGVKCMSCGKALLTALKSPPPKKPAKAPAKKSTKAKKSGTRAVGDVEVFNTPSGKKAGTGRKSKPSGSKGNK